MISKKDTTVKDLKEEKGMWIERVELLVAMRRQMAGMVLSGLQYLFQKDNPMNAPARTRPQEQKAHHEEIVSDNQEHDNTEDDETPVNPGLSMALEYLRKYQQDSNLDQREHEDCMDTHINEQQDIKSTNTPRLSLKHRVQ